MRIAIGQIWQETNTFNPLPTTRDNFEQFDFLRGDELVERMAHTNELGGFIQSLRKWPERPEIKGLVRLGAWPSGVATCETYEWLEREILEAIEKVWPFDAMLFALHGAMVANQHPDVEGDLLEAVRRRIGSIPLVATLDLHANVTEKMARHADALVLYHTAPHIDVYETGERGAAVLRRILDGARPTVALRKIPAVFPVEAANTQDPASVSYGLKQRLVELERQPGILAAGLATVQPWLDIPDLGSAVVVVSHDDPNLARKTCDAFAMDVWQSRERYRGTNLTPFEAAIRQAFEQYQDGLIVISDSADATTSGAPGDSSWLLKEMVKYDWSRPALITLVSPEIVAEAQQLGIGATRTGPLGGVRDHRFSTPVTLTTEVVRLFDARFTLNGHLGKNLAIDMGPSVVLRNKNVHLVVTTRSGPHFAPELFQAAGLDPFSASVLIAKSPCGFRAAYQDRAKQILVAQAPGCAPPDFWRYEYRNIHRQLWPWDADFAWQM